MSRPWNSTRPPDSRPFRGSRRISASARLVLPLPDSPMMPTASPGPSMVSDIPSTARTGPREPAYSSTRPSTRQQRHAPSPQAGLHDGLHGDGQEHERDRGDDDEQPRRDHPPPVAQVHGARAVAVLQDLAPGRQRRIAQAQERQAGLGQDRGRHEEDERGEHVRRRVRAARAAGPRAASRRPAPGPPPPPGCRPAPGPSTGP